MREIIFVLMMIFASTAVFAEPAVTPVPPVPPKSQTSPLSNAMVLPAIYVSYNMREGYRKFDGVDGFQHVYNPNLSMFGIASGKRWALNNPKQRIQAAAEIGWGSVKDAEFPVTLTTGDDIMAGLHSNYISTGAVVEMHLHFPADDISAYFLSAGPGIHLTYFYTSLKTTDGERIGGWDDEGIETASFSFNIGGGLERRLKNNRGLVLGYNFRFLRSARYNEVGGMFPMGVDYREFFFSHMLNIQVLLPRKSDRSRAGAPTNAM